MEYELYIDVFFLINFMMDYLLLWLLKRILSCTATHGRIIAGACLGAGLTCIVIVLPLPCAFMKLPILHCLVTVVMLKTGLGIRWGREFLRAAVFLYIGGFLLGGIMAGLKPYIGTGSLFFALSLLGYWIAGGSISLLKSLFQYRKTHCQVTLYYGGKSCRAKALIDTGNCLRDPVNGKPVSVVSPEVVTNLGIGSERVRHIPYQSIGETRGTLPVYVPERMLIEGEKGKTEICRPEIAACASELNGREFQVILNSEVYKEIS